jgi:hypothetical protein
MGSLQWVLSWVVMGAVGLAPILVCWVAGLIGAVLRRKRGHRRGDGLVQPHTTKGADRREAPPPM